MATQDQFRMLDDWLLEALKALGGSCTIVNVSKYVWDHHEGELRNSGDLFYTWQYALRWSANRLRRRKVMRSVEESSPHVWELAPHVMAAQPS